MTKLALCLKAGPEIGTGHLMRVRQLLTAVKADELVLFTDELADSLLPLCPDFSAIIKAPLPELGQAFKAYCTSHGRASAMLCDHYWVEESLERQFAEFCPVLVIDDLANRRHYCSLLIDQNIDRHAADYKNLVPPWCRIHTGPQYALINPAFAQSPAHDFSRLKGVSPSSEPPRVLVCFGGSDPVHGCIKTLHAIRSGRLYAHWAFTIIAGAGSADFAQLQEATAQLKQPERITLLRHCRDMPAAYQEHDLALGAYGVMFSERLAAGLPSVCVMIAENQKGADAVLERHQLGVDLPLAALDKPACLTAALELCAAGAVDFAAHGRSLYDGRGIARTSALINEFLKV